MKVTWKWPIGGVDFVVRYRCTKCGKLYERDERNNVACAVLHLPGQCCHYREREVEA